MTPHSSLVTTEEHIRAVVKIVSDLPRGLDPSGKPYRGVFYNKVRAAFYREFEKLTVNPGCSFDKPCGTCKRDVFQEATRIAEARRLISSKYWTPKAQMDSAGNRKYRRGYKKLYRLDELPRPSIDIDGLLATLGKYLSAPSERDLLIRASADKNLDAWNRWRRENSEHPLNLGGMDLSGLDLQGIDLSEAKMSGAIFINGILSKANLRSANLVAAKLYGSILENANLEGANLSEANMCKVNLRQANLRNANLKNANLFGAHLNEADLTGANLSQANFKNADLRKAKLSGANLSKAIVTGAAFDAEYRLGLLTDSKTGHR